MKQKQQIEIDWDRTWAESTIRKANIPRKFPGSSKRTNASEAACKHLLKELASYGRKGFSWPNESLLAADCGLSERTVKRVVAKLETLGLLLVSRRRTSTGQRKNYYTIIWSELSVLAEKRLATSATQRPCCGTARVHRPATSAGSQGSENRPATSAGTDQRPWDTVSKPWDTVSKPWDTVSHKPKQEPKQEPPPPAAEKMEVVEILKSSGLSVAKANSLAAAHELDSETAAWIVRTFQANADLFLHAGAIAVYIETGQWPAAGVRSAPTKSDLEAAEQRRVEKDQAREIEAYRVQAWAWARREFAGDAEAITLAVDEKMAQRFESLV